MEEEIDKLQNAFKLTELNLDYLEKRVETEFVDSTADNGNQESPALLMERLTDVKKEYSEIMKDVEDIKRLQMDAVSEFRNELLMACQSLQKLQMATGLPPPPELDYSEELERLSITDTEPFTKSETPPHSEPQSNSKRDSKKKSKPKAEPEFAQINKSPFSKRKGLNEFLEITQEEFDSVSTLVRGRVKLGDVNRTYRLLWEHFNQDKSGAPLSPSDMDKMSLRVSGATGEAKLKVLRSLKLLQIGKKGEVTLL